MGKLIRIKSWEQMVNEFGKTKEDTVKVDGMSFIQGSMSYLCDSIKFVSVNDSGVAEIDGWKITRGMYEKVEGMQVVKIKSLDELKKESSEINETGVYMEEGNEWFLYEMAYLCDCTFTVDFDFIESDGSVMIDGWAITPQMYTIEKLVVQEDCKNIVSTGITKGWMGMLRDFDVVLAYNEEIGANETALYIDGNFYFHNDNFKYIPEDMFEKLYKDRVIKIYRGARGSDAKTQALVGGVYDMSCIWERGEEEEFIGVECYLPGRENTVIAVAPKSLVDRIDLEEYTFLSVVNTNGVPLDSMTPADVRELRTVGEVLSLVSVVNEDDYDWKVLNIVEL